MPIPYRAHSPLFNPLTDLPRTGTPIIIATENGQVFNRYIFKTGVWNQEAGFYMLELVYRVNGETINYVGDNNVDVLCHDLPLEGGDPLVADLPPSGYVMLAVTDSLATPLYGFTRVLGGGWVAFGYSTGLFSGVESDAELIPILRTGTFRVFTRHGYVGTVV